MADEKLFIGRKLKHLRQIRGLSQVELARLLGVSPSYINLIEQDLRSASQNFQLSLLDIFGVNWRAFTGAKSGELLAQLRQLTQDPAFGEVKPDARELRNALECAPTFLKGFMDLYEGYQSYGARLAEQSEAIAAGDDSYSIEQSIHNYFRNNNNYFEEIETCIEQNFTFGSDRQEIYRYLKLRLKNKLKITIVKGRSEIMGAAMRHYDRERKILTLSDALDHSNQIFQLAHMIALIEFPELLTDLLPDQIKANDNLCALYKTELANYFAASIMMPYEQFHLEAVTARYDIDRLAAMFSVSYEQVCHRLTTLQRPGKRGIPFFFLRIDRGGNVSKRFNSTPLQLARYGGACPRLDIHFCFRVPGKILTQIVEMPDHSKYLTINRTVDRPSVRYSTEDKRLAVSLGCPVDYSSAIIYANDDNLKAPGAVTQVGVNCRLCPRKQCRQRAHDPFLSDSGPEENRHGITHI